MAASFLGKDRDRPLRSCSAGRRIEQLRPAPLPEGPMRQTAATRSSSAEIIA